MITGLPATAAVEKFDVRVEVGEHPYLPGYEFGKTGALGDLWILEIEVLDSDGDPAEGAKVRVYNGKKSIGSGLVDFNGIAKIKLALSKLGVQNLRIIATDDDPSGKGESSFKVEVIQPKTLQVQTKVKGIFESDPNYQIVLDGQAMLKAGCKDMNKLWGTEAFGEDVDVTATWPFNKSKRKIPLFQNPVNATIDEIIKFQNTIFPLVNDYPRKGYVIDPDGLYLSLGWQLLCQADSGELLILN